MKIPTIEQLLITARGDKDGSADFVANTMMHIRSLESKAMGSEILSTAVRRMDVNKKETFIMKLKHLPIGVLIALAISGIALTSGVAYAAYQLWQSPVVKTGDAKINQEGRTGLALTLSHCGEGPQIGLDANQAEITKASDLSAEDVKKVIQAECELRAIDSYGSKLSSEANLPIDGSVGIMAIHAAIDTYTLSKDHIIVPITGSLPITGSASTPTLKITSKTIFIANGKQISADEFKKQGEVITYIAKTYYDIDSEKNGYGHTAPTDPEAIAIIKLDLPTKYYGFEMQSEVTTRATCIGNSTDSCLRTNSNNFYTYTYGENEKPAGKARQIQGRITQYDEKKTIIKTSSGRLFTFDTPGNIIKASNDSLSPVDKNLTIEVGDMIEFMYDDSSDDGSSHPHITSTISYALLLLEPRSNTKY